MSERQRADAAGLGDSPVSERQRADTTGLGDSPVSERQRADATGLGDSRRTGFRGQITLDGPSGTGKSSVARDVARKIGAAYLDTGAMYRAATVAVLDAGVSLDDKVAVARAVSAAEIRVGTNARRELVTVDGVDVRERIRGAEVTRAVSPVSAVPAVR